MRERAKIVEGVAEDIRRGFRTSFEDIFIAALVVLPFSATLGILLLAMTDWPSAVGIVATGLIQGVGTFWNAGWRAREGS